MSQLLYRLRFPRPLLTIRSVARELWAYGRAFRQPTGSANRFVLLSVGRSGSSVLMDLLNSNPVVHCDAEILSHRVLSVDRFLAARATLAGRTTYGFRLRLPHLTTQRISDPAAFLGRLYIEGWRLVHLVRQDRLRQALSLAIARQRRVFHHTQPTSPPRPDPMRINPEHIVVGMRVMDARLREERAALAGLPHLALAYEDNLLRPEQHQTTLDRVFDFLGVERAPVTTRYGRIGTDGLADQVANLDEIYQAVRATGYVSLSRELVSAEAERHAD
jgi:hypothetical protein